jgi:hypothetical protein
MVLVAPPAIAGSTDIGAPGSSIVMVPL